MMILDVQRGLELAEDLKIKGSADTSFFSFDEDPRLSFVEYILHEIVHALSLGVKVGPGLENRVARRLGFRIFKSDEFPDFSIWEEAKTLACEKLFFEKLGLPIDEYEYESEAITQGVPLEVLRKAATSKEVAQLLVKTVDWAMTSGLVRA